MGLAAFFACLGVAGGHDLAELDTVVEPVIAETVQEEPTAPAEQETLTGELQAETDETADSETESYTAEQVEAAKAEAAEAARAEMQAEAEKAQKQWQQQQVDANWQRFSGDLGKQFAQRMAIFGAKQALERGRTPEEAAELIQETFIKNELDLMRQVIKPKFQGEFFDEFRQFMPSFLKKELGKIQLSHEDEERYRNGLAASEIQPLMEAALRYAISAARADERSKVESAQKEKSKTAAQVEKARTPGQIPQPTRGTGAPPANNPDDVMARAHPLSKEYAAAFRAKHGFDAPAP